MTRSAVRKELELVARGNRGDRSAFEEIYTMQRGFLLSIAKRFTADADEAQDVLQETFAYFLRLFPGFELTSSLRAFFYPVVKHTALTFKRNQGKLVQLDDWQEGAGPSWEPSTGDFSRMVSSLSAGQREVVHLRFVLGMKLDEIAAALDIATGTVKSRLHGALSTLREHHRTLS